MSAGIDYSMGTANVDPQTGIHYGIIHQGEVLQAWADSSEAHYAEDADGDEDAEPIGFSVEDAEYTIIQDSDDPDLCVITSPYYTRCRFCSPCAPGAGYLMAQDPDGILAYCLGHDWFEGGVAPYPVYRVTDGSLVNPE